MGDLDNGNLSRRRFLQGTGALTAAALTGVEAIAQKVKDQRVVRASIFPAIGVARVGDSPDEYFIGPEVVEPELTKAGASRDKYGALKRQAARFRVYGYNSDGEIVRELVPDDKTQIKWTVHLANKKAAWYRFIAALDIDDAKDLECIRRNKDVPADLRSSLIIDAGPKTITGKKTSGPKYQLDGGKFKKVSVSLGELRTDAEGRLLVLGGMGKADSPTRSPIFNPADEDTFNNADGWWDDIGDGPVDAEVTVDGEKLAVESSWVFVAPPNYAPDIIGWRTLYELLVETFVGAKLLVEPPETSFTYDILPILLRHQNLQWVNRGILDQHPANSDFDFYNPGVLARLSGKRNDELRKSVYEKFRGPELYDAKEKLWPVQYGDSYGTFTDSRTVHFTLPNLQKKHLDRWVKGEFIDDWREKRKPRTDLSAIPLAEQPAMLDRAALHYCLADAFHPGCEVTWPMRHATLYKTPIRKNPNGYESYFRINRRGPREDEWDPGEKLTWAKAQRAGGPLYAQGPGDLTKWMAVPWHGDTAFCRSGYEPKVDPFLPTFWPARVPNQVLSEDEYDVIMGRGSREEKLKAYRHREHWVRFLKGKPPEQMHQMIKEFAAMGVVEMRPGPKDDPEIPAILFVETLASRTRVVVGTASTKNPTFEAVAKEDPVRRAGWENDQQLEAFRRIRIRPRSKR